MPLHLLLGSVMSPFQCLYLYRKPLGVNLLCVLFLILYSTLGGFVFLHFEQPYSFKAKMTELESRLQCVLKEVNPGGVAGESHSTSTPPPLIITYSEHQHEEVEPPHLTSRRRRRGRRMGEATQAPPSRSHHRSLAEKISRRCVIDQKYDERMEWNLKNAILFGFGILTTLGYGKIEPQTTNGRLFTVIYGFIGVPFTVIIFTNFGRYIQNLERLIRHRCRALLYRCRCRRQSTHPNTSPTLGGEDAQLEELKKRRRRQSLAAAEDRRRSSISLFRRRLSTLGGEYRMESGEGEGDNSYDDLDDQISAGTLFGIVIVYLFLGAALMSHLNEEDVDFFSGIYYAFLCLTAIEYGKLIPTNSWYLPAVILYICFGLAISTIALDIGSTYVRRLYFVGRRIRNIASVQIFFGSKSLRVRDLLAALGHNIGLEPTVLCDLDLEQLVSSAIKVKEGRLHQVPQTHMIMDGIWPPELVPLFLKDGGALPIFVDAIVEGEKRTGSFRSTASGGTFSFKRPRWSLGSLLPKRSASIRHQQQKVAARRQRSVSAVSIASTATNTMPPERLPTPPPPMIEPPLPAPQRLSVRFYEEPPPEEEEEVMVRSNESWLPPIPEHSPPPSMETASIQ